MFQKGSVIFTYPMLSDYVKYIYDWELAIGVSSMEDIGYVFIYLFWEDASHSMKDLLSSLTRDWTQFPALEGQSTTTGLPEESQS